MLSLVGSMEFSEMRRRENIPGEGIIMSKQLVSVCWREVGEKVRQRKAPAGEELESHTEAVEFAKRITGNIRWCLVWLSGKQIVTEE